MRDFKVAVAVLLCGLLVPLANCSPLRRDEDDKKGGDDIMGTIIKANEKKEIPQVFEGDIIVTSHDKVDRRDTGDVDSPLSDAQTKRNAQRARHRLWKKKIIPYVISQLPNSFKPTVQAAMDEFQNQTCLKFVPHTNEDNWIIFVQKGGCSSSVGVAYWRKGGQELSLGPGCNHKGVIMHELLHALGFWHEQSRPDRNQYVEVLWENIVQGKAHNFNKYSHGTIDTLKATYDFKSIMHYGGNYFSKNGQPTLRGYGPNKGVTLGQRNGFTKTDIFEINGLYDCKGSSNGWSSWSDYGPCKSDCKKIRQRFCSASDMSACPGADRYGIQSETKKCPKAECNAPVQGHWGRWSSWSNCNVPCGKGSHTRTRLCDDPPPKNGGKTCVGDGKENGICSKRRCGLGPDDCEFQLDTCSVWKQADSSNTYRWYRQEGETSSSGTGPSGDVSLKQNGTKGYYMYAEASSPVTQGQVARLQSKVFPASAGRCMQFAYSMYGGSMGSMDVYVIDVKNGKKSLLFSKSGDQGKGWHKTNATIVSAEDYKISFEAKRGSGYQSDIALDDIMFKDGACNAGPNPSTAAPATARPTTARPTTARPTTARPTTARPTTARPTIARPTTARPTTARPTTARPCTTARPTTARPTTARPTTARPTTARSTTARPTTARPTTARRTTGSPTGSDNCTFEVGQCFWSQVAPTDYKWYRHTGSTTSSSTGPDGDVTKNLGGAGYYMYAEASSPVTQGQVASLQSKVFPATAGRCMQFSYSMYGGSMGSLDVYVIDVKNGKKFQLFSKSGNQGQGWHKTNATIMSRDDYKISFEVTRGSNWNADIALDDIMFNDGACNAGPNPTTRRPTTRRPTTRRPTTRRPTTRRPTYPTYPITPTSSVKTLDCDFEQDMCKWSQGPGTNLYPWARHSGATPTSGTGPSQVHTTGNGTYLYMETSWQSGSGQTATLVSPPLHNFSARCMRFYYSMNGLSMGSLNVYIQNPKTGAKSMLFTKSGDQGDSWQYGAVTIASICEHEIVFEGVRGTSYLSDIALDDITFADGACP